MIGKEELHVICKLVRMSIFNTEEDIPAGVQWSQVMTEAGAQGVSAVCHDALKHLPADSRPDFVQMGKWDLAAREICENYRRTQEATQLHLTLPLPSRKGLLSRSILRRIKSIGRIGNMMIMNKSIYQNGKKEV